jgi:hypothetical protein
MLIYRSAHGFGLIALRARDFDDSTVHVLAPSFNVSKFQSFKVSVSKVSRSL